MLTLTKVLGDGDFDPSGRSAAATIMEKLPHFASSSRNSPGTDTPPESTS
jgi:hypothetical protein